MTTHSRRDVIKKTGLAVGAVATVQALPANWTKPVVNAVILPAHAQTSVCETLLFSVTMDDLSALDIELREFDNPNNRIQRYEQGEFSGDGTLEVFNLCLDPAVCYEVFIRNGSGSATYSFNRAPFTISFSPQHSAVLGESCR